MHRSSRLLVRFIVVVALAGSVPAGLAHAQTANASARRAAPALTVDARLAAHSLMAITDAHLQKTADVLHLVAATDDARSADWERIRGALAGIAPINVPAVLWFARPNGDYWTLPQGRAANLSDRPYFLRATGGETVIGELVVSRSSHRNTAIVAVPVRGAEGRVVGVLGASVHLDSLGARVRRELGGLEKRQMFFAIDSTPRGAVHSDSSLIFTEPMQLGDEGMRQAFRDILAHEQGTVTYTFRGSPRTLAYVKSPVTGWWYAFGAARD